jgi:HPt (histidine-containing phosphotransfer) domain-containing protein
VSPLPPTPQPALADQALPHAAANVAPAFLSPYLDTAAAVERLSGLTALYLEVARDYVGVLDRVETEFRHAAAGGEWEALVAQAHSLKGISATLGAQMLSDHAAGLEKLFRAPPADLVPLEQLPALLELVAATRAATRDAEQVLSCATPEMGTVPARTP